MKGVRDNVKTAVEPALGQESSDHATFARSVPVHNWRAHWLTVVEFSRVMGRRPPTIYEWVHDGTLAEFGIPVCQFRGSKLHSGRVFIQNIY